MAMYYEYVCKSCHVVTAAIHGMNEEFNQKCEHCGSGDWQQVYFPNPVHFHGSGFHQTDYASKKGG